MSHKRKAWKPKWHICSFVDERCADCPHAVPHLVEVHMGFLACGGHCEHTDRKTHCSRARRGKR